MVGLSNQNRKTDKVVFLLGGNDLEMEEIRKVLELLNVDFCLMLKKKNLMIMTTLCFRNVM